MNYTALKLKMTKKCVTAVLALSTWRRTVGGSTKAEVAGGAAKRDTLRGTAEGNRSATFAPLKISPGTTISQGQCIARLFGRRPRRESLREAAYEAKQAVIKDVEARRRTPIERDP